MPLRKDLDKMTKSFPASLSPVLTPEGHMALYQGNCILRERKQSEFPDLLDTDSELTRILGDPKKHCGPQVKEGAYGIEVINGVWVEIQLTVGPVVLFLDSECVIRIDTFRHWYNPQLVP